MTLPHQPFASSTSPAASPEILNEQALAAQKTALKRNELRLRSLVYATAQVVWMADEAGNITELGNTWGRYTGRSGEELRGWGWLNTVHPEDRPLVMNTWKKHLKSKTTAEIDCRVRFASGYYRWIRVRTVPVFDEDGTFVEWVGTCTDVDFGKRAEAALRKSEERYRTIIDTTNEGVSLVDSESLITFVNSRLADMLGYTPRAMQGHSFVEFFHEDDREAGLRRFQKRRNGVSDIYDVRFRRRNGDVLWALISGSPFYDESGEFAGSLGMVTDITERKRAEEALRQAKETAEEMARLKSTFLANMSHEIRTPLTAIMGFTEALKDSVTGQDRECVDLMSQASDRLMETLTSVLDLAQLESGTLKLKPVPLNLNALVHDTVLLFERQAEAKGIRLEVQAEESKVLMLADRGAIGRVLNNLISNAIKFTMRGGVTVRIEEVDNEVILSVEDTGVGISDAFVPRLFDDFEQESYGLARDYEGAGLGLPITKRLVDVMGGRITVESTKGSGSTFRVVLPKGFSTDPADDANYGATRRHHTVGSSRPAIAADLPERARPSILLLEDNRATQMLVSRILFKEYRLDIATDPAGALANASARRYDVVLMDISLGGNASGVDTLHTMRRLDGYAHVPVIAVTANALPEHEDQYLASGFDAYLSKPFSRGELLGKIESALRG